MPPINRVLNPLRYKKGKTRGNTLRQSVEKGNIRWKAILLVGPTGSGKTPLGQLLEQEGLWGRQCVHFDFGEALRASAKEPDGLLTKSEFQVVENVLKAGALLEDKHFPIARKLLVNYLTKRNANIDTLVILNGLPRHAGQAEAMETVVDMQTCGESRVQASDSMGEDPCKCWRRQGGAR